MVDTGSMLTLMSEEIFSQKFPGIKLMPSKVKLSTYTGTPINVCGKAQVNVESNISKEVVSLDIYIVEGNLKSLVGRDWLREIQLDWTKMLRSKVEKNKADRVQNIIVNSSDVENLLTKYTDIFQEGVGKIPSKFQASLSFKPHEPVFKKPFKVPLAIEPLVSAEIERLERDGVITKISHSDYATPVVPIIKKMAQFGYVVTTK